MQNVIKFCLTMVATFALVASCTLNVQAQVSPAPMATPTSANPWKNSELVEPSELAGQIKAEEANTLMIFNIGAVEDIRGARHIGPVNKAENLEKFKKALAALPKNTSIVIYCGCCPFAKCPNIRPAYLQLKNSGFTHGKVLNLPVNLKTNWITPGYPLANQ